MILASLPRSQALFHLGYTQASPAGDRAAAERAFDTIPDSYTEARILTLLERCEAAWDLLSSASLFEQEREVETGDTNQVTSTSRLPSRAVLNRSYFLCTQQLAFSLGIRNFRDESSYPLLDGALYINSVPGATGDRGEPGRRVPCDSLDPDSLYLAVCLFSK